MKLTELDMSEWPTIRYGGRSVTLDEGLDYIHLRFLKNPTLTLGGLEKLVSLTDDEELRAVYQARRARARAMIEKSQTLEVDKEKRDWRRDPARLQKLHREGNG
jgi:hypothetical protein